MLTNPFTRGPEGWCSYDYHASMVAGKNNVFILATWHPDGGPEGSSCVWTDHTRWSADTPERPLSILPLLHYRSWVDADPVDLCDTDMSVSLRGDDLVLDGAECYFWVHGGNTRWHLNSTPLEIGLGRWPQMPSTVQLTSDESLWHNSWSGAPEGATPLADVLGNALSYGFAFVGFSSEVMGRLSMSRFEIHGR